MKLHIAEMLRKQKKHLSFHTPGHKRAGEDITELSYSDNLYAPTGVLKRAEEDIARILGAGRSFLLTDGSTCGVHAMLYALARTGARRVLIPAHAHLSVKNGCALAGLAAVYLPAREKDGIPCQPTLQEVEEGLRRADALLLTSPDYYGNFPDLAEISALCRREKKPLLIDGAHGAHLHGTPLYAGNFADMWVDGVHKSLPANTQGAVVSARAEWASLLEEGVRIFRTSSPSYPILASVEYAVKYPRNERLEEAANSLKRELNAYENADWSKILIPFGERCATAQAYLESCGVYPEFNDGNYLMFYLSPASKLSHLRKLKGLLARCPRGQVVSVRGEQTAREGEIELLPLAAATGRVCARECGLFPPCIPLFLKGEKLDGARLERLKNATSTFGLTDGKIAVFTEE